MRRLLGGNGQAWASLLSTPGRGAGRTAWGERCHTIGGRGPHFHLRMRAWMNSSTLITSYRWVIEEAADLR